jgi:hypothetical protein
MEQFGRQAVTTRLPVSLLSVDGNPAVFVRAEGVLA